MTPEKVKIQDYFEISDGGIYSIRPARQFGLQDVGISPGGPMDLFAAHSGNLLLGKCPDDETLEIIFLPKVTFVRPVYFVLTGAPSEVTLSRPDGSKYQCRHATVSYAEPGTSLLIGKKLTGLRTYLSIMACDTPSPDPLMLARERGDFEDVFSWRDPEGKIRVIEGPEYSSLKNPEDFTDNYWVISSDFSDMGMRLEGGAELVSEMGNMISDAVSDGTVQLTPKGPIILLCHRQTVGGYPRIFNVISADVDLLAQYMPKQVLHFKKVTLAEAWEINSAKQAQLESFRR